MLRVVVGKYGGSHTLYVNGSWYVGISFVISEARDCRLLNCHIARSSSQLGSWMLSDDDFIISPPVVTLPDFLLLSAVKPFVTPLYSCERTSDPWPFINTLSLTSISSRIDGKKSINFFCYGVEKKEQEKNVLTMWSTQFSIMGMLPLILIELVSNRQWAGCKKPIIDGYCEGLLYVFLDSIHY